MVMQFRADMEAAIQSGKNSDQERRLYQGRVSSLMAKDKLRLHASEWQWQGIERILEKDEDGRNLISRGWGISTSQKLKPRVLRLKLLLRDRLRSARELQRLKLLGEETVAAARESRDPIAVLSEEEKLAAKLAKEQDVAMPVPEGPKDRYFCKKQRPNSTAAARSVTAGRRAANQAAAAVEAKEDAQKQKQADVSKVKKMASKAKRHNAGELVSQPAVAAAPAPAVVAQAAPAPAVGGSSASSRRRYGPEGKAQAQIQLQVPRRSVN